MNEELSRLQEGGFMGGVGGASSGAAIKEGLMGSQFTGSQFTGSQAGHDRGPLALCGAHWIESADNVKPDTLNPEPQTLSPKP